MALSPTPSPPTRRQFLWTSVAGMLAAGHTGGASGAARPVAADEEAPPGVAAAPAIVRELRVTLDQAVRRFQAKDLPGVLAHVSDKYWTGFLTKAALRNQLGAIFRTHRAVRAPIRIDDVRMVGEHAWVYTTGVMEGTLPLVDRWYTLFSWDTELEVARREGGAWRLYGYQN